MNVNPNSRNPNDLRMAAEDTTIVKEPALVEEKLETRQFPDIFGNKELALNSVPDDWEYNDLLVEILKALKEDDICEIKMRIRGAEHGFGRRLLDSIKNGYQLFDCLEKAGMVNRDNLLVLQAVLYRMGKTELFAMAADYAQTKGNVIHFKTHPAEPENGYTYVRIHIDGKNFKEYSRASIEGLRAHAARLIFVPPEHVVIAGIEPSSSLLLILMVPSSHVKYLQQAVEKRICIKEWSQFGVDFVEIEGTKYQIDDKDVPETTESQAEKQLEDTFHKFEKLREQFENVLQQNMVFLEKNKEFTQKNKQSEKKRQYSEDGGSSVEEIISVKKQRQNTDTITRCNVLETFQEC